MGFIQNIIDQYRQKVEDRNAACNQYIKQIDQAMQEIYGLFEDMHSFITLEKEAHSHLVLAGAGTGKTTTIVGKIKYLIKSGQCKPEDIVIQHIGEDI